MNQWCLFLLKSEKTSSLRILKTTHFTSRISGPMPLLRRKKDLQNYLTSSINRARFPREEQPWALLIIETQIYIFWRDKFWSLRFLTYWSFKIIVLLKSGVVQFLQIKRSKKSSLQFKKRRMAHRKYMEGRQMIWVLRNTAQEESNSIVSLRRN